MQGQTQVNKTQRYAFGQYRETSQRKMNVGKQQFKNFEIPAERYHFRI